MTPYKTLENSIAAGVRFIYLVSQDEFRAQRQVAAVCKELDVNSYFWTFSEGACQTAVDASGKMIKTLVGSAGNARPFAQPMELLGFITTTVTNPKKTKDGHVFVLQDFHYAMHQNATIIGALKNLINYSTHATERFTVIVLSNTRRVPAELEHLVKIIELDLLSIDEIRDELKKYARLVADEDRGMTYTDEEVERLSEAALGLSEYDLTTLVFELTAAHNDTKINPKEIIEYKKNCIARGEGLEYYECAEGLEAVGGLDELKEWLSTRRTSFSSEAREFGLPIPKGIILLGVPGTGKSLTCKTIAHEWNMPLVKLDIGRMMGGLVGTSESNIRRALKLAETISPCVLWIDELDKALSGVKSSSQTDGGTIARVFSTVITWLQEKTSPVFVVATANSFDELPPELLRKGRFDECWFCDVPNKEERKEIFSIHLKKKKRDVSKFNLDWLADNTEGFVGSEIEECILSAMHSVFSAHKGKRDIETMDIGTSISHIVPLSKMQEEKIEPLRKWAVKHARFASKE